MLWPRNLPTLLANAIPKSAVRLVYVQIEFFGGTSIKSECLDKMIFFGQRQLRRAIEQFVAHYHGERNHQGIGNKLIVAKETIEKTEGRIGCSERLGGLLRYYHKAA